MYRSASTTRVWDDYLQQSTTASPPPPSRLGSSHQRSMSMGSEELPLNYQPEMSKKDRYRAKFADNAVHFIPLVVLLCASILWFFSNPNIQVPIRGDSAAAKIEGMTLEGELDTDSAQTGVLAGIDLGDLDPTKTQGDRLRASTSKIKKINS